MPRCCSVVGCSFPAAAARCSGRAWNEIEPVEIDAVGAELVGDAQILAPDLRRLSRQPVEQVDHQRDAVAVADAFEETDRLLLVGAASQPTANLGIETLHPDRYAVDARGDATVDLGFVEMDDAALKRDFAIRRERQAAPHGVEDVLQIVGRKRARRAAAKIHRFDGMMADAFALRLALDLVCHADGVGGRLRCGIGVAVEGTEQAMIGAEGNVDIGEPAARRAVIR